MEEEAYSWSMNSMSRPKFPLLENLKYHGSQYQIDNVARGEMTTITYVYKKKTLYIFKAPKKSKFLNILVLEVGAGSWR